jgi:SAM-dependent methyltransferase
VPHWTDAYYGDLYFDSAADLLTPALSEVEAEIVRTLLRLGPGDRVLDLACGHGRHAWPLAGAGLRVVGVERSEPYVRHAAAGRPGGKREPRWVRGDVRALPLRAGAFDGAFSWYSSLFMFDDAENLRCLAALGRAVRPGGRVVVQHANPLALARSPVDSSRRVLSDGSVVEEESRWDAAAGVDRCARRLVRPDGTELRGTAELRYYGASEWVRLGSDAGLRLLAVTTTTAVAGSAAGLDADAPDLVAVLERPA